MKGEVRVKVVDLLTGNLPPKLKWLAADPVLVKLAEIEAAENMNPDQEFGVPAAIIERA